MSYDRFNTDQGARQQGPAESLFAVTKSDSTVFTQATRAIWVGGAGDIAVRMVDQTTGTIAGVAAGTLLPIRCDKVLSTGTTATSIIGFY